MENRTERAGVFHNILMVHEMRIRAAGCVKRALLTAALDKN
jgi:hypothetical protein